MLLVPRWMSGLGVVAFAAGLLAACGSSGGSSQTSNPAAQSVCSQVTAVLSDGPDPGADPVGYAFAQIHPLRQIKTTDQPLQKAIDNLASAYQEFYDDNGVGQIPEEAVNQAGKQLDAYCPGATS